MLHFRALCFSLIVVESSILAAIVAAGIGVAIAAATVGAALARLWHLFVHLSLLLS